MQKIKSRYFFPRRDYVEKQVSSFFSSKNDINLDC